MPEAGWGEGQRFGSEPVRCWECPEGKGFPPPQPWRECGFSEKMEDEEEG